MNEAAIPQVERRQRPDYVTKGEFTDFCQQINGRLDTQDTKLSKLDNIEQHVTVTCNLFQWVWRATKAIFGLAVVLIPTGKMLGWW
jgi:hypothetical protein